MTGLDGAVVMVTGADGGIGRAAVSAFSAAGTHVLAAGRSSAKLEEAVALAKAPELVTPILCDVTNSEDVATTVAYALTHFGRLDCAFNNAGTFGRLGLLHDDDEENFRTVVDTNLRGLWLCLKHQIPVMVAHGGGSIVNCSSMVEHFGRPQTAMYAATKHAVIGLSKSAAVQYAGDRVRVNVISQERSVSAEEVANSAVWLASPLASTMTGQTLVIEAGIAAEV